MGRSFHKSLTKGVFLLVLFVSPVFYFWPNTEIMLAWVTFVGVLCGLFVDKINGYIFSPELNITINSNSEYLHEVESVGQYKVKQTWLGLKLENTGIINANDVMIYWSGIQSNRVLDFSTYRNIPLGASWTGNLKIETMHPHIGMRFDICWLYANHPNKIHFALKPIPSALVEIICPLHEKSEFEFYVTAVSSNCKSSKSRIKIIYDGKYLEGFEISCKKLS